MIKHINDDRYKALIDWLRSARIEQGLSVRDLGKLLDEPHQFVVKIETCERKLNVFEFVQYCEALKLDTSAGLCKLKELSFNSNLSSNM
ncbi:MAG: helix-turn-helix domain-containing protein [Colwellia sp.]|nr:helix-turn-helix domain-containing protein [Colwellia sp.]MCW9081767.1 helix-turn-helix domain-containing protein [Colwellia sp.]